MRPPFNLPPFDLTGVLLGDPDVSSAEFHNHSSAGVSLEVNFGTGWCAFGRTGLHYFVSSPFSRWCLSYSDLESPVRPAPVYAHLAHSGVSYYSYDFKLVPKETDGRIGGRWFVSLGMEVNLTVTIEVTNGAVSVLSCSVKRQRRLLLYQDLWYN